MTERADERPEELARAAEKAKRRQERVAKHEGFGATDAGQAIARTWLPELTKGLEGALRASKVRSVNREFLARIRELKSVERLALCILYGALNSIGRNESYAETAKAIGTNISVECCGDGLTKGYGRTKTKRIAKFVAATASLKERPQKFNSEAAKQGYKTDDWSEEHLQQAGNWAINQLLMFLPGVLDRDDDSGQEKHLTLTPEAVAYADSFVSEVIQRKPVWLPETKPPRPWTGWNEGGTWDPVLQKSLHVVRSWHKQTDAVVKSAIREGTMQPALDALNALQAVPWTINQHILHVILECTKRKEQVPGLPGAIVPPPKQPDGMDAEQALAWKEIEREIRRGNRRSRNDRVKLAIDLQTAERMADHERFYTAMNFDWRGRVTRCHTFSSSATTAYARCSCSLMASPSARKASTGSRCI
jgi:DNA-directed RNA polymerase, mitochondrial